MAPERSMTTEICTTCFHLVAPCEEPCACTPRVPAADPRVAEARIRCVPCLVCGLVIVRGHTRWCQRVCRPCREVAQRLNAVVGRCVVPIGVHSIVNGAALRRGQAAEAEGDGAVDRFVAAMSDQVVTISRVYEFGAQLLESRISRLGLGLELTVGWERYLQACVDVGVTAEGAWDALFGLASLDTA